MDDLSFIGNADPNAIEYLYKEYLKNPDNVDAGWQKFFQGFDFAQQSYVVDNKKYDIPKEFKISLASLNL